MNESTDNNSIPGVGKERLVCLLGWFSVVWFTTQEKLAQSTRDRAPYQLHGVRIRGKRVNWYCTSVPWYLVQYQTGLAALPCPAPSALHWQFTHQLTTCVDQPSRPGPLSCTIHTPHPAGSWEHAPRRLVVVTIHRTQRKASSALLTTYSVFWDQTWMDMDWEATKERQSPRLQRARETLLSLLVNLYPPHLHQPTFYLPWAHVLRPLEPTRPDFGSNSSKTCLLSPFFCAYYTFLCFGFLLSLLFH